MKPHGALFALDSIPNIDWEMFLQRPELGLPFLPEPHKLHQSLQAR